MISVFAWHSGVPSIPPSLSAPLDFNLSLKMCVAMQIVNIFKIDVCSLLLGMFCSKVVLSKDEKPKFCWTRKRTPAYFAENFLYSVYSHENIQAKHHTTIWDPCFKKQPSLHIDEMKQFTELARN